MPRFRCAVVSPTGARIRMDVQAPSRQALVRDLDGQGISLLRAHVVDVREGGWGSPKRRGADLLDMVRSLNGLLRVGLSVPEALSETAAVLRGRTAATVESVAARVAEGEPLAAAMARHPGWFDGFFVGVVHAGERSGQLQPALDRLERKLERDEEVRAEVVSALIYPTLLAVVGGAAVCVLLGAVLPRFGEILSTSGGSTPAATQLVLTASAIVSDWWLPAVVAATGAASAMQLLVPIGTRSRVRSLVLLSCPGIGSLRRELLTARYARMLSVLLGGGAPLLEALGSSEAALDDPLARKAGAAVKAYVRDGGTFGTAVEATAVFAPTLSRLVAVGESTGRLAEFLERAADFYEARLERALRRSVALIEPAMIVTFGFIVGFVALAVVQSIYSINTLAW